MAKSNQNEIGDLNPPRRFMNKQEAIRHLIHAAIRMIAKMEDPFAIHMLVHSADKMLIDIAKHRGVTLHMDWETVIRPEYHKPFFARIRRNYNYLKHADEDAEVDLPIHNIMETNLLALFFAALNYRTIYGVWDGHMQLLNGIVFGLFPNFLMDNEETASILAQAEVIASMTPAAFFSNFEENPSMIPTFSSEKVEDLKDIIDFYHLTLEQIRSGAQKASIT